MLIKEAHHQRIMVCDSTYMSLLELLNSQGQREKGQAEGMAEWGVNVLVRVSVGKKKFRMWMVVMIA